MGATESSRQDVRFAVLPLFLPERVVISSIGAFWRGPKGVPMLGKKSGNIVLCKPLVSTSGRRQGPSQWASQTVKQSLLPRLQPVLQENKWKNTCCHVGTLQERLWKTKIRILPSGLAFGRWTLSTKASIAWHRVQQGQPTNCLSQARSWPQANAALRWAALT